MNIVKILGLKINNMSMDEVFKKCKEYLSGDSLRVISTPNTEAVMFAQDNNKVLGIINSSDLVIPDGIGLIIASKMRKKPLKERVTGYDLSIKLLEEAGKKNLSLYILGGKDGVAKRAAENIKKSYPGINISGVHSGYFKGAHLGLESEQEDKIISEINENGTDIIFVGMGFPKQDVWIAANKDRLKAKIIIGNGGVSDILAGDLKRAPEIYQKLCLEWLYRLIKEPSRIRRQIVLPLFLVKIISDKNSVQ